MMLFRRKKHSAIYDVPHGSAELQQSKGSCLVERTQEVKSETSLLVGFSGEARD